VRTRLPSWVTLDRWLVGGALLVLVLLAALVLNVVNTRRQQQIARLVSHTNELLDAIAETRTDILLLASADQTFLLTNTEDDLRRLVPLTSRATDAGRRIVELGRGDPRQEARIPQVLARLQALSEYYVSAVDGEGANANLAVRYRLLSGYGPRLIDGLDRQLVDMDEIGRDVLADRAAASERAFRTALATGVATGLSSMALVVCFVALLRRHLRKRLRDAGMLRLLSEELREADRRKDQFLATLAHELRNPLAALSLAGQRLRLPDAADRIGFVADVIGNETAHMTRLVEELFDIASVRQGKVKLRMENLDLVAVAARAVDTSRPVIERRGHAFDVVQPAGPIRVHGDETRLCQVVANLLTNAARYTREGGRIALTLDKDDRDAIIRVEDTGVGIAADMLPRVFDLFTQVRHPEIDADGGLGIGLALVKNLVALHGGTVAVTSAGPGLGSVFVVRIPLLVEH